MNLFISYKFVCDFSVRYAVFGKGLEYLFTSDTCSKITVNFMYYSNYKSNKKKVQKIFIRIRSVINRFTEHY